MQNIFLKNKLLYERDARVKRSNYVFINHSKLAIGLQRWLPGLMEVYYFKRPNTRFMRKTLELNLC